jgi:predicted Zn-dependent protease
MTEPQIKAPDSHHVLAASGWIELGDAAEATRELEMVEPSLHGHPEVLNVRWNILASGSKWEEAVDLARTLRDLTPDEPLGWIHLAYALHELKRTQEAFETLQPIVERFPQCETIPYNLACYTAQMGQLDQARKWLKRAMKTGHATRIKSMALEDLDLKPLWPEIRETS